MEEEYREFIDKDWVGPEKPNLMQEQAIRFFLEHRRRVLLVGFGRQTGKTTLRQSIRNHIRRIDRNEDKNE